MTKKEREVHTWVQQMLDRDKKPPTYAQVAVHFGINRSSAYRRCQKFKELMGTTRSQMGITVVKCTFNVPKEKFDIFAQGLSQLMETISA